MSTLRLEVPRKLKPLLQPARYKGAHGGRGGAKSHFFAEQVVLSCLKKKTRIVCIREVQNSIKDSVRQLVVDKIGKFGLGWFFQITETEIKGKNGSLIIFRGMQHYNAENIKSLEGYDIAWVEEAQTFSERSLELLRPTIRNKDSELWFSWNPRYKTDPVDMLFRRNKHPDAVCVEINWRDNPWFPEELRKEMEHDFSVDADKAEHVWNGAYGTSHGAILAKWINKAEREGRIHNDVEYDKNGALIEISSDIGFRDTATWWYWQRKPGGYSLIKYDADSGLDAEEWCDRIKEVVGSIGARGIGKIWLPHDARAKTFQSKHSSMEKFITAFGADKIGIVPQSKKADQINAARTIVEKCEFHKSDCEDGLDGLLAWEYEWNQDTGVYSKEPLHNWASHPSDGFAYGCQVMQQYEVETKKDESIRGIAVGQQTVTLDEMWNETPRSNRSRI